MFALSLSQVPILLSRVPLRQITAQKTPRCFLKSLLNYARHSRLSLFVRKRGFMETSQTFVLSPDFCQVFVFFQKVCSLLPRD